MKYIFFGTPEFAAIILEKLIQAGLPPALIVCNPDRPLGRKKIITPPPVKQRIMNYESRIKDKIKIFQPEKLDKKFHDSLFMLHNSTPFDLFIVAAYGKILPKEIIEMPRLGTIGVHPSLLPKYRGPTPIQTAILNGEKETGVTLFLMDEKIDHGAIVSSVKCQVSSNDNYKTLMEKLAGLGTDLLIQFLGGPISQIKDVGHPYIELKPQNEAEATYTKKFAAEDAFVDLERDDPKLIARRIRALNPEPGTWTIKDNKRVKLLEAEIIDGKLKLQKIQVEGKKPRDL